MDKAYHDRKMLKWLPFQSLTEQGKDILSLIDQQYDVSLPNLSDDQYHAMQYRFEEAFVRKEEVTITYIEHQRKKVVQGIILAADFQNGLIVLNKGTIAVKSIIDLH